MLPGGTGSTHDGASDRASYCEPKKYMRKKVYTKKNTWHQNLRPKKLPDIEMSHEKKKNKKSKQDIYKIIHFIIPLLHHLTIFGQGNVQNMSQ